MSTTISLRPMRATLLKAAVGADAAAAALIAAGSYGNAHQWSAVPFVIGFAVVVSALVFGLLAPRGLRAIEAGAPTARRWSLGHGVATVLLLVVFWSGAELVVGTAALLLGVTGRRRFTGDAKPYTVTLWLAGSAMALSVVWTVLSATALGN